MSTVHLLDSELDDTEKPLSYAIDTAPNVLANIYQCEHNIALWQRKLDQSLVDNIETMLRNTSTLALVQTVTPDNAAQWIENRLSEHPCAKPLGEDIALVVDMFCCLFDLEEVGLRLTKLDKPMCPKFHVDHVPCRLVTTYVGTATEWLANQDVNRDKLGSGSAGLTDSESGLYSSAEVIKKVTPGDIALLKGSGWEGNEAKGIVHRSPAMNNDQPRLLLTLDMI
ncbi:MULTISPECIES: DUF1826 domain-containing protein [unclassified Vibrio]|uniref:DUF1826 domain-containing protein n=1 Tax=Vibrio sp. HB236076 TaxID=3232307 RepID=A0AB39HCT8_9VIBR|nr:DUF1826 domain-containing protein [Vibrio sp. HB161653]MDP5254252.1 DUF1826 domain-containing protein [Vibrio sp. HB161653]